jgi:hypothetical protein
LLEKRAEDLKDLDYLSVSVDGINSYKEIRGVDFKKKITSRNSQKQRADEKSIANELCD